MLKMLSAPALGLGASLTLCMLPAGCSCEACFTEPPPVVRMEREHAEADRSLLYLVGRGSELLEVAECLHAGDDSPPEALREVRRDAVRLHLRLVEWRLGSDQLFHGQPFMTLPSVSPPVVQPGGADDVQLVESDPDRYYAALQQALPPMLEKCDQIESDLSAFLNDAAATQK